LCDLNFPEYMRRAIKRGCSITFVCLCLLRGWSQPSGSQKVWQLQINTEPTGAQVYLVGHFSKDQFPAGGPGLSDDEQSRFDATYPGLHLDGEPKLPQGSIKELSGRPFSLSLPSQQTEVEVLLLRQHCLPLRQQLKLTDNPTLDPPLKPIEFPSKGQPYLLQYRSGFDRLRDRAADYWWAAALAMAGLLGSLTLYRGALSRLQRQAEQLKSAEQKEHRLSDLVASSDGSDPFVGAKLDEYRILQKLGQGGMAKVYRAVPDETMDEKQAVAVKVMSVESSEDAEMMRRFEREKRVYEALNHPNIVKVLASGLHNRQAYLVMELVRGSTLKPYILPEGMKPSKVEKLLAPVFLAVAFAHRKGVVHRDLKPDNIMVTDQGVVKVMDFGLARKEEYTQITGTGSILGTPAYIAPEQIQGLLDPSSDQYALGVILFQMLTGKLPFESDSTLALIMNHMSKSAPLITTIKPELSKVSPVVERMLAKKPEDRYRDLELALKAFRAVC
jgi:tRNA A-37 threonylcarbamoyl transferase component Bud32